MIAIGLSSGSLPAAPAAELAAATLAGGGTGVDLRIGKGHGWERAGVAAGLAEIASAGLDVFFTGIGLRLGEPTDMSIMDSVPNAVPVKVFCVAEPDLGLVTEQLAAARSAGLELWVETHKGGPHAAALAELCAATGTGVVLDLLGVEETGGADPEVLAPHVRAIQVKGVAHTADGRRHRPLNTADLDLVNAVLAAGAPVRAVTVETRAGSHLRDLAVLAGALPTTLPTTTGEGHR